MCFHVELLNRPLKNRLEIGFQKFIYNARTAYRGMYKGKAAVINMLLKVESRNNLAEHAKSDEAGCSAIRFKTLRKYLKKFFH